MDQRTNIAIGFLTKPDIETITGISTARKEQLLGEAYFLRSYITFLWSLILGMYHGLLFKTIKSL
jgi:hypothetical protein